MTDYPMPPDPVEPTEAAVQRAIEAMKDRELENHGMRIGITGGGCSGLQYLLDFHDLAEESNEDDFIYERHGLVIIVDCFSAIHLTGAILEYVDELSGSGFKFTNTGFTRSCGCGSSVGY